MKLFGFCWRHEWKCRRNRYGFTDEIGRVLGTVHCICEKCGKTKYHWDSHLPNPSLESLMRSRGIRPLINSGDFRP